MEIYVVQSGDTLPGIANRFGVSVSIIAENNGLSNGSGLAVGQALIILYPTTVYTVRIGDTLTGIAQMYGTTIMNLYQNNPHLASQAFLMPGQLIVISYEGEKRGDISINGYAYPHINRTVLRRTLPFLTILTIFGYGFREDGSLITTPDNELINLAYQFNVAPFMLLSSIDESGHFSGDRASLLFNDLNLQNRVIDNIIDTMHSKGYLGLDVDFEFVYPEDGEEFLRFVQNITNRLNAEGFTVNVDLAPKTSADQPGLLYEAHNYRALGEAANTVLLMTYEWGYTYSEPMAVAPLNQVRRVVEYALTEIPADKIFLGIPNYGYVWPLPYESGVTTATAIGNEYAVQLAVRYGAQIQFDEVAQSPYFEYTIPSGRRNIAWFEDVRSINGKLDLISEKNLRGAGYWNVMRSFAQNWALVNNLYNIRKIV
ncbi:LysM peptidoglycan-binding domain-containing protein [Anaeropeptidivorans aminofermentans]|jgi:spore germination protein|uniref:LysM peptidoglycan-binding domain-containing protein n=1 Tax=Anaeropeptidivorans aminofermentans TaxID=2934315 RepID=UPI002023C897|nr:LysM peptidoglycan-binding domain-containing protein [Anaeropeptidivorans aminofermentans]